MNKKEKTERCQAILKKYPAGRHVAERDEVNFLLHIFQGHTQWEEKQGCGVESISVIDSSFGTKCFQLNRADGSSVDISFMHSIKSRSKITDIRAACRSAIRPEIVKFRTENVAFGVTLCPISGEVLTQRNTHIDHFDSTFDVMFQNWLDGNDIGQIHSKIVSTAAGGFETYFVDQAVIDDFVYFHNLNCRLRAVSKIANLSMLKT